MKFTFLLGSGARVVGLPNRRGDRQRAAAVAGFMAAIATIAPGWAQVQAQVQVQAQPAPQPALLLAPLTTAGSVPPSPWRVVGVPKQAMPLTQFSVVETDGRRALRIEADKSYGNLVHPLNAQPVPAGARLGWQWRLDRLLPAADLRRKDGDDVAAKVCVFFDLPLAQIPFGERQLLRLARAATADPLPGATVCYVWDATLPVGTSMPNAYTARVRYLVLQSGETPAGLWKQERRDIAADFVRLFGAESPRVPPIIGVAVGADADNTGGRSVAHVAGLVLESADQRP